MDSSIQDSKPLIEIAQDQISGQNVLTNTNLFIFPEFF